MTVTLVAAVARNGVIGRDGQMPWHLPEDLKNFKATTMNHVLVMGRRTYESIGPLPGRTTVVVTRNGDWHPQGVRGPNGPVVATSISEALTLAAEIGEQVYVAGGGQVYTESLPHADELLISWVDAEPDGDTFFPLLDWDDWAEMSREQHDGWALARYERTQAGKGYRGNHGDQV